MLSLADVRKGLEENQFFLEYLPTIHLSTGSCHSVEALLRWRSDCGKVLQPNTFIPTIERSILSGFITYRVVELIAADFKPYLDTHLDFKVSINVPAEVLGRGGVPYALQKNGFAPWTNQIIYEVTERSIPDTLAVEAINALSAFGVDVALDDVALLNPVNVLIFSRCSFGFIKIDKSLTDLIVENQPIPEWVRLVRSIIITSQLTVVVEGVETAFQLEVLKEAGIQYVQGFYFCKPLPYSQIFDYIDKVNNPLMIDNPPDNKCNDVILRYIIKNNI